MHQMMDKNLDAVKIFLFERFSIERLYLLQDNEPDQAFYRELYFFRGNGHFFFIEKRVLSS